jgi:hypothetical protein
MPEETRTPPEQQVTLEEVLIEQPIEQPDEPVPALEEVPVAPEPALEEILIEVKKDINACLEACREIAKSTGELAANVEKWRKAGHF